ncbi:sigma-54 interaction domain-containing protein [Halalkalibacter nanhaiisediminis]|uniref:HTH-type transcriptional regulatory protein TyrR n=1 Tax=Halalkalibacter nanhaiisediminis TaxID=688079 RepID=A0A562QDC3_9BACI|nr:sigma 54-interacting transcriptional regulator [Halalkalibacter nanhaiisediminis]TWI54748.1 transcriptional regulator with PAS, ATPase and Fis domain [Halalkalibacter nanhaiisediminis]
MVDSLAFVEMEAIFNACYDGIYVCDKNLVGIWVNEEFERTSGIPSHIWKGNSLFDLKNKGYIKKIVSLRVLEEKKEVTMLQTFKTGKTALVTGTPIFSNGTIDKIVTTTRNLTDLNRLSNEIERSEQLKKQYQKELELLKQKEKVTRHIIYKSPPMKKVIDLAFRVSQIDSLVLLLGESGVGKEIIANLLHETSQRKNMPFVEVNCGAIPKNLLESELFGYVGGSFTGATKQGKKGLFTQANHGTIFLDEIGELTLNLQVKLLRVLENLKVTPVGGIESKQLDIKIIAATNRNLEQMVQNGTFREDLYYRLNIIPIHIPPLRNRKEDIIPLCEHFLAYYNNKHNQNRYFHHSVLQAFENYHWPGNVRELRHLIERLVVLSNKSCIETIQLPLEFKYFSKYSINSEFASLKEIVENAEKFTIQTALVKYKNANQAAKALQISQPTMSRKMKYYKLN